MKQNKLLITFVFAIALMASFASAVVGGPNANGTINGSLKNDSQLTIQGQQGTQIGSNDSQTEGRMRIMAGNSGNGQAQAMMETRFERGPQGGMMMHSGNSTATTDLELSVRANSSGNESGRGPEMRAMMSNGQHASIKVMPDQASKKALEQLRMRTCSEGCTIELKEVGSETSESNSESGEIRAAYEVRANKDAKVLGIFNSKMDVSTQVNAESGEVTNTKKPWWDFLASEADAKAKANAEA